MSRQKMEAALFLTFVAAFVQTKSAINKLHIKVNFTVIKVMKKIKYLHRKALSYRYISEFYVCM